MTDHDSKPQLMQSKIMESNPAFVRQRIEDLEAEHEIVNNQLAINDTSYHQKKRELVDEWNILYAELQRLRQELKDIDD